MNETVSILRSHAETHADTVLTRTAIPRLDILKVTTPTKLFPEIYKPLVSLILQGEKRLLIGQQVLNYTAGHMFIASIDLPAIGEVVKASAAAPYLALRLTFDLNVVVDLVRDVPEPMRSPESQSFCVTPASDNLLDAWLRMLRLLDDPDEIAVMGPLLEREILFRILRGPQGSVLRQIAGIDSRFTQIKNVLISMRKNYARPFRVEDLADLANMSASAFHRGFKATTGMSPLQYQKHLRLYEARGMLLVKPGNVAAVACAVGYESLSQFTREFTRMFGTPPARNIRELRASTLGELVYSA